MLRPMNGANLLLDAIYALAIPPFYLWHRYATHKYGPRLPEKLGYAPQRSLTGERSPPCLWLHAVSVGEVLAARPLVEAFAQARPAWEIRVSVTTATGRQVAEKHFGAERVFYYPFDASWMVRRAFGRICPSLIVLMELEVWPNFVALAAAQQVPVVVANARITERSARRFRAAGQLGQNLLMLVTHWCCQSDEYAARLRALGVAAERVDVVGSLKYDNLPTDICPATRAKYRELFGLRPDEKLFVAGSTHRGEEEAVLQTYGELRQKEGLSVRLLLAPRHPERAEEIEQLARKWGSVRRRSALSGEGEIILLDTVGELAAIYSAADLVFVGGTLIAHGGQNMMEPCGLARPTIVGPSVYNFEEAMARLRAAHGIREISAASELTEAAAALLLNPAAAAAMAQRGQHALRQCQGAAQRTLARLTALLAGQQRTRGDEPRP